VPGAVAASATIMNRLVRPVRFVAALGLLGANLATLLALLAPAGWPMELFAHFPVQYALAQILGVALFLAWRPRWLALVSLPLLALNLWALMPYYFGGDGAMAATEQSPRLRLMTLNVQADNPRADLVVQAIQAENPDIVVLLEVTEPWWKSLPAEFRRGYPHLVGEVEPGAFGIVLLSRAPLAGQGLYHFGMWGRPGLAILVCPSRQADAEAKPLCVYILTVHPDPPITGKLARSRDAQFLEMREHLTDVKERRRIVMGDLNNTPWSPVMREFLETTALRDSALGRGIDPTWFSRWLPFGIPIDHILHSDGIAILDRRVGPDVGSDHFPVIADIALIGMPVAP
jgi:endonuclease/exonuclease/phosphatase (EEP) superfamily protein YafD